MRLNATMIKQLEAEINMSNPTLTLSLTLTLTLTEDSSYLPHISPISPQAEINMYKSESAKQRKIVHHLEKERERFGTEASDAGAKFVAALEEVKLREMTIMPRCLLPPGHAPLLTPPGEAARDDDHGLAEEDLRRRGP